MLEKKSFKIGNHLIGDPSYPLLIAEIACAHDGDPWKCSKLIEAASKSGADAIQLQIFSAQLQVPRSHKLRELLENLEIDRKTWKNLFSQAKETGLMVSAFVYDEESLEWVQDWDPDMYKLNSSDLTFEPMLKGVAKTKKPLTLGTGASQVEEIRYGVETLKTYNDKVILMHGVQDFPTEIHNSRLNRIEFLKNIFNGPFGFADHTDGSNRLAKYIDLIALGQGASVFEKHITLDRKAKSTDYQAALEPETWSEYAKVMRALAPSISDSSPEVLTETDKRYRNFQKKKAFSSREILKGESLTDSCIKFMRSDSEFGILPQMIDKVLGKIAKEKISQEELLRVDHFIN